MIEGHVGVQNVNGTAGDVHINAPEVGRAGILVHIHAARRKGGRGLNQCGLAGANLIAGDGVRGGIGRDVESVDAGRHGGTAVERCGSSRTIAESDGHRAATFVQPELHGPRGIVNVGNHRGVRVRADDLTGQREDCQGQYQTPEGWSNEVRIHFLHGRHVVVVVRILGERGLGGRIHFAFGSLTRAQSHIHVKGARGK